MHHTNILSPAPGRIAGITVQLLNYLASSISNVGIAGARPNINIKVAAYVSMVNAQLWHYNRRGQDTNYMWTASSEFGTYRLCEQRRFRRACAFAQSRQNLRCSLIQAVSQEEPSDRKPDPWPL